MIYLKLFFVIITIVIFYFILTYQIEKFNNNDKNTSLITSSRNYINTNEYDPNYFKINSCVPFDIMLKNENSSYYDYGNDELNTKFYTIFNINYNKQIALLDGIEWSKWNLYPCNNNNYNIKRYYNKILKKFIHEIETNPLLILPNKNNNFKVILHTLNRYKYNKDKSLYLYDIDVLIYRKNRPLARHIKIIASIDTNNMEVNFIFIKIIGVINQNDIDQTNNLKTIVDTRNFAEYIPEKTVDYNMNDFIYDTNDKILNSQIEYNLYNKILKDFL